MKPQAKRWIALRACSDGDVDYRRRGAQVARVRDGAAVVLPRRERGGRADAVVGDRSVAGGGGAAARRQHQHQQQRAQHRPS